MVTDLALTWAVAVLIMKEELLLPVVVGVLDGVVVEPVLDLPVP